MRKNQSNSKLTKEGRNNWAPVLLVVAGLLLASLAATTASAEFMTSVDPAANVSFADERRAGMDLRSDPRIDANRVGLSTADLSTDRLARPPKYQERPSGEWQGMRVDLNVRQACKTSDQCGNALVCIRGACLPCGTDDQCGEGAVCVLDHCVLEENAICRQRSDCAGTSSENAAEDALCMLSGYSHTPRGNEEMEAFCAVASGGTAQSQEDHERLLSVLDARAVKMPVPVDGAALLADVEQHLAQASPGQGSAEIIDPYFHEGGIDPIDSIAPIDSISPVDPIDSIAPIDPEGGVQ